MVKKESSENHKDVAISYFNRNELVAIQTPQAFEKNLLLKAYETAFSEKFYGTDDGSLVENFGFDNTGVHNGVHTEFTHDQLAHHIKVEPIELVESKNAELIIKNFISRFF